MQEASGHELLNMRSDSTWIKFFFCREFTEVRERCCTARSHMGTRGCAKDGPVFRRMFTFCVSWFVFVCHCGAAGHARSGAVLVQRRSLAERRCRCASQHVGSDRSFLEIGCTKSAEQVVFGVMTHSIVISLSCNWNVINCPGWCFEFKQTFGFQVWSVMCEFCGFLVLELERFLSCSMWRRSVQLVLCCAATVCRA